jgi:hypothetical protein
VRPLQTVAGFQTVVNPVTARESPYHDACVASRRRGRRNIRA